MVVPTASKVIHWALRVSREHPDALCDRLLQQGPTPVNCSVASLFSCLSFREFTTGLSAMTLLNCGREIAGLPQQIQPGALLTELRVVKRNPLLAFVDARLFHIAQSGAAIV
jgi:hypothetical protein